VNQQLTPNRQRLVRLFEAITPWDEVERTHLSTAVDWVRSDAPIYRTRPPDVPVMHLVSYFVACYEDCQELLLVAHRKSGLWLPSGGHVEPDEDPWDTVLRECVEELHVPARPSAISGDRPLFITATQTVGQGPHTDVSLWYVIRADRERVVSYDDGEFSGIRWVTLADLLDEPIEGLDPQMHRFTHKLLGALTAS